MSSEPDPWTDDDGLPPDPQRRPWDAAAGFRSAYREQLRHLDEEFGALGRVVGGWATRLVGDPPFLVPTPADLDALADRAARLEDDAFTTIARQAPVGGDLRATVAIIRSTYDLLRAGRLVRHVGDGLDAVLAVDAGLDAGWLSDLARLRAAAVDVFAGGVRAWEDGDVLAVGELRSLDDEVGRCRDSLLARLPEHLSGESTIASVLLCRYLERLGDHGVNLAAQVAWAVTGDRVIGHSVLGGPSH